MLLLSLKVFNNVGSKKKPQQLLNSSMKSTCVFQNTNWEKWCVFLNLHRDISNKKKVKIYNILWFTKQQSWQISFCAVFSVNCSQWKYFTTLAIISASHKILQQDQNKFCTDESFSNKSPLISWQVFKQNSSQTYSFWPGTWVQENEK